MKKFLIYIVIILTTITLFHLTKQGHTVNIISYEILTLLILASVSGITKIYSP
jgi:hypothetical protein